jgi:hypothetical protein
VNIELHLRSCFNRKSGIIFDDSPPGIILMAQADYPKKTSKIQRFRNLHSEFSPLELTLTNTLKNALLVSGKVESTRHTQQQLRRINCRQKPTPTDLSCTLQQWLDAPFLRVVSVLRQDVVEQRQNCSLKKPGGGNLLMSRKRDASFLIGKNTLSRDCPFRDGVMNSPYNM